MVNLCLLVLLACYCIVETRAQVGTNSKADIGDKKVVCYYTVWSHSRKSPYGFNPDLIDPFLCTHLVYAFADIGQRNNLISSDPLFDFDQRAYTNITSLKIKNPNLKVMLSIGGWAGGSIAFARISATQTNRTEFAKSAVRFIRGYSFDGLDLNWQHPNFREGGSPKDKENYVLLAQALREEFERESTDNGKPRLQLSIAITHNMKFLPYYDLANFNIYMDFISVICYDYHFSFETVVNHHAPLFSVADLNGNEKDAEVNTNFTINYFLEFIDAEKLVLGIPTFGRTYKLLSPEETGLGSDSDGAGEKGPITGEKGFFAYFEICNYVKLGKWKIVQPKPGAVGPYAFRDDQWVGYDDIQMITQKAAYAVNKGLGGVMFWTLDYDDFLGTCHGTKFPIIKAARNEIFKRMTFPEDAPSSKKIEQSSRNAVKFIPPKPSPEKSKDALNRKSTPGDKKVVCYYTFWSHSRKAPFGINPDQIDPFLCTHLIYAFADIGQRNNLISSDPVFDFDQQAYANITALKIRNPNLKVMLSIGGWTGGSIGFAHISATESNRTDFAKNAVRFLRGYSFDGLDLNWQHPNFREGGTPQDKENYVLLAQVLRQEFERESGDIGKPRLLLSIAITHNMKFLPYYDLANFNIYMDFINVICYDYHFSFETVVNHHAPLYSVADLNGNEKDNEVNTNFTMNYFAEFIDWDKLVMGIPLYGRTYKLYDPEETALGSDADGAGDKGPVTGSKGFYAYFEICMYLKTGKWTVVQPKPGAVGPYAYKDDQWVGYDDMQMIKNKAAYANDQGLGGVMFWTLDFDDYLGSCDGTKFPIIKAARNELFKRETFPEDDAPENPTVDMKQPETEVQISPAKIPKSSGKTVGSKAASGDKKVVCYYTFWSHSRKAPFGMNPDQIDPFLCTHLIYAFADIGQRNNLISSDTKFDFDERAYANITALKIMNPKLKVMLSTGGWTGGTLGFARISATETNRTEFAKSAVRFIRAYSFDGLDLNWQHPNFREGGTPQDKENYVLLAQTLRQEFERESSDSGLPRLLLSIAITHNMKFLPYYDLANFNIYMDFINVICYDYHFSFETAVNHHAPLYSVTDLNGSEEDAVFNTNFTMNYFAEFIDRDKLVMGIPLYGRTYKLYDPEVTGLGSDADGPGEKGPVTDSKGFFAYFEICMYLKTGKWTVVQPKPGAVGPYAHKDDQWVGYDDIQMIRNKVAYTKTQGLAGVMFWTVDFDDFIGSCDGTKFPIIKAARDELFKRETSPEDVPETPTVVMKQPETKPPVRKIPAVKPTPVGKVDVGPKAASGDKKVVCYYTFWSHSRKAPYGINPDQIDPFLCTHLIYAFADIGQRNNLISSDPVFDFDQRAYANITALKDRNPNLKVMLSIGGWTGGTLGFAHISASQTNRTEFSKSAVSFLRAYTFDGLDLNWQHPNFREGGTPQDKENYVLLAQALRQEFERESSDSGKPRLLLSIAITHNMKFLPFYDLANFNIYMDFINVICYDYHFSFETVVNHHAPLYSVADLNGNEKDAEVNTNFTINYFAEFVDRDKLVMGIPLYGRTYKLYDPEETALGADADGPGEKGPVTDSKGFYAYFEICMFIKSRSWTVVQPKPGAVGPYAYRDDQWVGYDDIQMIQNKAAYANEQGLGGVMFWTVDFDDFLGKCDGTKFPIIKAARNALFKRTTFPEDDEPEKPPPPPPPPKPKIKLTKPSRRPVGQNTGAKIPDPPQKDDDIVVPRAEDKPKKPVFSPPRRPTQDVPVPPNPVYSDDESPPTHVGDELVKLIEKAGGLANLSKLLMKEKNEAKNYVPKDTYIPAGEDPGNSIVFKTQRLPPIVVTLNNSSVFIKEVNVFSNKN